MIHLAIALAVGFVAMATVWLCLQPLRMPLLIYFIAYIVTTVIGAAALLDDVGLREFEINQPMFRPADYPLIGSTTYWILLLAPFFLVPVGAALGRRATNVALVNRLAGLARADERYEITIVYWIACACAAYCLWKLFSTGAYFPGLYFDRTLSCNVRLMRRIELFTELRYLYYAFAYSVIPIGATIAMLSWIKGHRGFHAAIFFVLFTAGLYLNIVLYMKANLVVFFIVLLFACILAKTSLRLLLGIGLVAVACLLSLQGLLGCYRNSFPESSISSGAVTEASAESSSVEGPAKELGTACSPVFSFVADTQDMRSRMSEEEVLIDAGVIFVRSVIFRMAASLPYYVQVFSSPEERCGIESNSLPFIPRETCYPATKVGRHVNPGPIQEFLPAPAHISAYAEVGLGYALFVLLLAGFIVGFCWGVAQKAESPLFWAAGAAVCVFAYYLTQASFTGALMHSYGFVWYLFPIVTASTVDVLARIAMRAMPSR